MALSATWSIAATPTHGGNGKWFVRERRGKRAREAEEADVLAMEDSEEKISKFEKTYKKTCTMHAIVPPPESWSIAANEIIQVDVKDVGFTPARVTKNFGNGWFQVSIKTSQYTRGWTDCLNYLEEGTEWIRTTSPQRYAKPLQIVPPTAAALGVPAALEASTSLDDATTIIDEGSICGMIKDAAEDDAESVCSECRLVDKEAADEQLLKSAKVLIDKTVPRMHFCLYQLTLNANSLNLQKALLECAY